MNPFNNAALLAEYQRTREMLLASFPELADDEDALADTVDGETELLDAIAGLIRASRIDAALEKGLDDLIGEMAERRARIGARSEKRREAAFSLMQAADVKKIERPDFTASIGPGRKSVIISDATAIPANLCRTKTEPDKAAIKAALENGATVPGAAFSNAQPVLTVRTR